MAPLFGPVESGEALRKLALKGACKSQDGDASFLLLHFAFSDHFARPQMIHLIMREVLLFLLDGFDIHYTSIGTAKTASRLVQTCMELSSCWDMRWALQSLKVQWLTLRVQRVTRLLAQVATPPGEAPPRQLPLHSLEQMLHVGRIDLWRSLMAQLQHIPDEDRRMEMYTTLLAYSRYADR